MGVHSRALLHKVIKDKIHFIIWTNKFCNLYKYILKFGQIQASPRQPIETVHGSALRHKDLLQQWFQFCFLSFLPYRWVRPDVDHSPQMTSKGPFLSRMPPTTRSWPHARN